MLSLSKHARGAFLTALLASCSPAPEEQARVDPQNRVACALAGAKDFSPRCALERAPPDHGAMFVIRHPNGGFRRLRILQDGLVESADGAEKAVVKPGHDSVEIALGQDRYRLGFEQLLNAR